MSLFAIIYFSKVQKKKYKKTTFGIYIKFKIVTVQYLLSQNEFLSLQGWKKNIKTSVHVKILQYNKTSFGNIMDLLC